MNVSNVLPAWPTLRNRIADSVPGIEPTTVGAHLEYLASQLLNVRPIIDPSRTPVDRTLMPGVGPSALLADMVSSGNIDRVVDQLRSVSERYAMLADVNKPPFFAVHRLPQFCTEYAQALTAAQATMRGLDRVYSLYAADPVTTQAAVTRIVEAANLDALPSKVISGIENGHVFRLAPSLENYGGQLIDPSLLALNKDWELMYAQFPDPVGISSVAPMTDARYRELHDA